MRMTLVYPDGRKDVIRATSREAEKGVVFFVSICQSIAIARGAGLLLFDDGEERRYFTKSDPVSFVDYYKETHVVVVDESNNQAVGIADVTHVLEEIPYWIPYDELSHRLMEHLGLRGAYSFWGPLEQAEAQDVLDRWDRLK